MSFEQFRQIAKEREFQQWQSANTQLHNNAYQSAMTVAKGASQYPTLQGPDLVRVMSLDRATAMNDKTMIQNHQWFMPK